MRHAPASIEWHQFLVRIPFEPPRPLTPRVWLAWLVHSVWTRGLLCAAIFPAILLVGGGAESMLRDLRDDRSLDQLMAGGSLLILLVVLLGTIAEGVRFARLVAAGTCVVTRVRAVRARTERAGPYNNLYRAMTDTRFEYQGGRDGFDIQGGWNGRIRFMRQPVDGQAMPVLFDREHPKRRLLLWEFGLTMDVGA